MKQKQQQAVRFIALVACCSAAAKPKKVGAPDPNLNRIPSTLINRTPQPQSKPPSLHRTLPTSTEVSQPQSDSHI